MEAPKPINFSYIRKDITSEQGHNCSLQISFNDNKFEFIIEKEGKIFKEIQKRIYNKSNSRK